MRKECEKVARRDREHELQQRVLHILHELRGLEALKESFWSDLCYHSLGLPASRRGLRGGDRSGGGAAQEDREPQTPL